MNNDVKLDKRGGGGPVRQEQKHRLPPPSNFGIVKLKKIVREISKCHRLFLFPLTRFLCRWCLNDVAFHRYMMRKDGLKWFESVSCMPETAMRVMNPDCFKEIESKKLFTLFYQTNYWGGSESASGPGSDMGETQVIRTMLPELVKKYSWKRFVDIPCGDWNWMRTVDLGVEHYFGGDIVPDIVESNTKKYGNDQRTFQVVNLMETPLPSGDVLFCRDCLVHLSYEHIGQFLCLLHKSGIRYLLSTTFTARDCNSDIVTGSWRAINLEKAPFNFPAPLEIIIENSSERGGRDIDKSLALWEVRSLPAHLNLK
jgi:hypothetical protein